MIVIISTDATESQIQAIVAQAVKLGLSHHLSRGAERSVLIVGGDAATVVTVFEQLPGVDHVLPVTRPYRLASREVHPRDTIVQADGVLIGGPSPVIIAGASSTATDPAAMELARALREAGANVVRAGVYRPHTSLYGMAQIDPDALARLDRMRREAGLPVAVEVLAADDVAAIARHADLLIVGAEQMHSRPLLQACGWSNRGIVLERAESARIDEWLQAADQLLAAGNRQVVLCELGIRTYEPTLRRTLDLSSVPYIRRVSHLPVLVDPYQTSEGHHLVEPLALAALAAGAHGLSLAVHLPGAAPAEGEPGIDLAAFRSLTERVRALAAALAITG